MFETYLSQFLNGENQKNEGWFWGESFHKKEVYPLKCYFERGVPSLKAVKACRSIYLKNTRSDCERNPIPASLSATRSDLVTPISHLGTVTKGTGGCHTLSISRTLSSGRVIGLTTPCRFEGSRMRMAINQSPGNMDLLGLVPIRGLVPGIAQPKPVPMVSADLFAEGISTPERIIMRHCSLITMQSWFHGEIFSDYTLLDKDSTRACAKTREFSRLDSFSALFSRKIPFWKRESTWKQESVWIPRAFLYLFYIILADNADVSTWAEPFCDRFRVISIDSKRDEAKSRECRQAEKYLGSCALIFAWSLVCSDRGKSVENEESGAAAISSNSEIRRENRPIKWESGSGQQSSEQIRRLSCDVATIEYRKISNDIFSKELSQYHLS